MAVVTDAGPGGATTTDFTALPDLAAKRFGGMVLAANDEFFAPKENLLEPAAPAFAERRYTDRGKWMDGWETRRSRSPGYDWCVLRLGLPGVIRGVVVDTSFFRGNYPEACSIEGCALDGYPDVVEVTDPAVRWVPVLPRVPLQGDSQNRFPVEAPYRFTHLRLNIFPDGGVARLRVHGEALPDPRALIAGGEVDLAATEHGGRVVDVSDLFFSDPANLLAGGRAADMSDGWETRRRRGPGNDWVVIRLGARGTVRRVEVDTSNFKGNFPESCAVEVADGDQPPPAGAGPTAAASGWRQALPRTRLLPHWRHVFDVPDAGSATHVRFSIYPDGGVARLRVLGTLDPGGVEDLRLRRLNAMLDEDAAAALLRCCGSGAWARDMASRRPFAGLDALVAAGDAALDRLGRDDLLEAFAAHPRIGERRAPPAANATAGWAAREQSATARADPDTLAALAEGNRSYEDRFGYTYIVFATGKGADEMLDILRGRLDNPPERELGVAAEEQRKITRLRLEKLLRE